MIDFVGKRWLFYWFSLLVMLPGIISLVLPNGLRSGIEFSSGTTFTARFEQPVTANDLGAALTEFGHPGSRIQTTSDGSFLVRTNLIEGAASSPAFGPAPPSGREKLENQLEERFGSLVDGSGAVTHRFLEYSSVSASVSSSITRDAALAVLAASIAILIYITVSFISVPNPVRYGACALLALLHDVVVTLGAASILGRLFHFEVDTLFITAMLTIVGFSVHDTIVVFDRVRENVSRAEAAGYEPRLMDAVNASLNQTLGRSLEHLDYGRSDPDRADSARRLDDSRLPRDHADWSRFRYLQLDLHREPGPRLMGRRRPHRTVPSRRPLVQLDA